MVPLWTDVAKSTKKPLPAPAARKTTPPVVYSTTPTSTRHAQGPGLESLSISDPSSGDESAGNTNSTSDDTNSEYSRPFHDLWGLVGSGDKQVPWWFHEGALLCCIDLENNCWSLTRQQGGERKRLRDSLSRTPAQEQRLLQLNRFEKDGRPWGIGLSFLDGSKIPFADKADRWSDTHAVVQASTVDFAIIENDHVAPHHPAGFCPQSRPEQFRYGSGKPIWIHLANARDEVVGKIKEHFPAEIGNEQTKHIVFVFHATNSDLKWLETLGIYLQQEFPNCTILDTQHSPVAKQTSQDVYGDRNKLCKAEYYEGVLGVNTTGAHNGGNDAVHELKAFLAEWALTEEQRAQVYNKKDLPVMEEPAQVLELVAAAKSRLQDAREKQAAATNANTKRRNRGKAEAAEKELRELGVEL